MHFWSSRTLIRKKIQIQKFQQHTIKIKNSLTNGKSQFEFSPNEEIKWYACGPTVYDSTHIGHARTYICTDIIRRILSHYFGLKVNFALGITDIDDKIIQKGIGKGYNWNQTLQMAREYEFNFFSEMSYLNVLPPDSILRVTEHIPEIISYISKIESEGLTYQIDDGIYFNVDRFGEENYGKLGPIPPTSEPESSNPKKKNPRDFVLWKFAKPGEPFWSSPWGSGRPGWHIECSAMTHSLFGPSLHFHSGGIDLRFPHHTNEIAQCEAHNCGSEWVSCWMHTGHLHIQGQKMSKSLKNFVSIQEYLSPDCHTLHAPSPSASPSPPLTPPAVPRWELARDLRFYFLMHRYSSSLHFSPEAVSEARAVRRKAEAALGRIDCLLARYEGAEGSSNPQAQCRTHKPCSESLQLARSLSTCQTAVKEALADDFDTPLALSLLSSLLSEALQYSIKITSEEEMQFSISLPLEPLLSVERYAIWLFDVFGLNASALHPNRKKIDQSQSGNNEETKKCIDGLVEFRSRVRSSCISYNKSIKKLPQEQGILVGLKMTNEVMEACDWVRNDLGKNLGIKIEDLSAKSIWRPE